MLGSKRKVNFGFTNQFPSNFRIFFVFVTDGRNFTTVIYSEKGVKKSATEKLRSRCGLQNPNELTTFWSTQLHYQLLHKVYLGTGISEKLEMVEMEVILEVKMDAPILPSTYTGALAPPSN